MAVVRFNNSLFSQLFESNDIRVIEWARNVYDKVKGNGILPLYIDREKGVDFTNISIPNATLQPLLEENENFTFGRCISGQDLPLDGVVNIGRVHTIELETSSVGFVAFRIMEDDNTFLNYIEVRLSELSYVCGGEEIVFSPITIVEQTRIKVIRSNYSISCYVNDVLVGQSSLISNVDYFYNYLVKTFLSVTIINYGLLYNREAVIDERNIASSGWHVPSSLDYQELADHLGGNNVAGGKMKEVGTDHWIEPNSGATNEIKFFGRGAGFRGQNGDFFYLNEYCFLSISDLVGGVDFFALSSANTEFTVPII